MAYKKITDLQLIASIIDALSIPCDNGIQTYRMTPPQLITYINAKLAGNSIVTPVAGDHIPLLDASDSNLLKRVTLASLKNAAYRSVTATDSVGADDETMKLSGASFTSTLPANGNPGKRYKFIHAGTSLSQIYTLATTGGATIGAYASGAFKLVAKGEMIELEDDGTNWIVVGRIADTGFETYTPTMTGFGTPTNVVGKWRKRGEMIECYIDFTSGTATGVEGRFSMPSGATSKSTLPTLQGAGWFYPSSSSNNAGAVIEPSKTYFTMSSAGGLTKSNASSLTPSGLAMSYFGTCQCEDFCA